LEDPVLDRHRPDNLELSKWRQAQTARSELDLPAGGKFMRRHNYRLLIQWQFVEARVAPRGAAILAEVVQRRFCPATAPLPTIADVPEALARSATVFFGFFTSRFDLFCPFAMSISNNAGIAIAQFRLIALPFHRDGCRRVR
jgi:hypothetical protein